MADKHNGVLRVGFKPQLRLAFQGAKRVRHARHDTFQLAEVASPRRLHRATPRIRIVFARIRR